MLVRTLLWSAVLVLAWPVVTQAQGVVYSSVRLKTFRGTVAEIGSSGIKMNTGDGVKPVVVGPKTNLSVVAVGDAGFVRIGSTVTVTGKLVPGGMKDASISVHANPAVTAIPRVLALNSDAKSMSVNGVVTSLNPLTVELTDLFRPTIKSGNVGVNVNVPPVPGGRIIVEPSSGAREKVRIHLGPSVSEIRAGDTIEVTFAENQPRFPTRITVTKKDEVSSKAKESEKKPADQKE